MSINDSQVQPIIITLAEKITVSKLQITPELYKYIRSQVIIENHQFALLKKINKSTWNTPAEISFLEEDGANIILPRGFLGDLLRFCQQMGIAVKLIDKRHKILDCDFSSQITLFDYQRQALETIQKFHVGVIVAPPGSGKTVIGLELIARLKQPALILVHRKELLDQWVERAESFLGIDKKEIGYVGSGKKRWGKRITVATLQTLYTMMDELPEIAKQFGMVIIDECHHVPANTFRQVITNFNPYYLFGLTATPQRKNHDEKIIFLHIGNIICTIDPQSDKPLHLRKKPTVHIRETELELPFEYSEDQYELLSKVVVFDSSRNLMITRDILEQVKNKRSILVLTERKEHVELLNIYLRDRCHTVTLTGDDPKTVRKEKLAQVRRGEFQVLIATGQLMGEGVDIANLDCLFLVYPFSFEGKLVQYIGRIQRTKNDQLLFDYHDARVGFLSRQFRKRYNYYAGL